VDNIWLLGNLCGQVKDTARVEKYWVLMDSPQDQETALFQVNNIWVLANLCGQERDTARVDNYWVPEDNH